MGWLFHPTAGCTCQPGGKRTRRSEVCRRCCYLQEHLGENRASGVVSTGNRTRKGHHRFTKPIPPQRGLKRYECEQTHTRIYDRDPHCQGHLWSKNVEDTGSTPSYWPKLASQFLFHPFTHNGEIITHTRVGSSQNWPRSG